MALTRTESARRLEAKRANMRDGDGTVVVASPGQWSIERPASRQAPS